MAYPPQPPNFGPHPYYSGMPPRKPKTGLVVGLIACGVLLVAGIVVLIVLLNRQDNEPTAAANPSSSASAMKKSALPPQPSPTLSSSTNDEAAFAGQDSPQELAELVVHDYQAGNLALFTAAYCRSLGAPRQVPATAPAQAAITAPVTEQGTTITITSKTGQQANIVLGFANEGGLWCIRSSQ